MISDDCNQSSRFGNINSKSKTTIHGGKTMDDLRVSTESYAHIDNTTVSHYTISDDVKGMFILKHIIQNDYKFYFGTTDQEYMYEEDYGKENFKDPYSDSICFWHYCDEKDLLLLSIYRSTGKLHCFCNDSLHGLKMIAEKLFYGVRHFESIKSRLVVKHQFSSNIRIVTPFINHAVDIFCKKDEAARKLPTKVEPEIPAKANPFVPINPFMTNSSSQTRMPGSHQIKR
ncbi:MAG: hypothetical protein AB7V50_08920 [Vampirovibrionia bacterium]